MLLDRPSSVEVAPKHHYDCTFMEDSKENTNLLLQRVDRLFSNILTNT